MADALFYFMEDNSRLVYSTEDGIVAGYYGDKKKSSKQSKKKQYQDKNDGIVRVRRETKGRKGKAATVVTGIPGTSKTE
jgi:translation initiation factor 1